MTDRIYNVLFLCTGNSARSVIAESILRKDGEGRFRSFSAGSQPKGTINPFALKVLERFESCPVWPGQPTTEHWGIEDPAAVEGTDLEKQAAFEFAFRYLKHRISEFTNLPLQGIDELSLGARLREIGRLDGATHPQPKAN